MILNTSNGQGDGWFMMLPVTVINIKVSSFVVGYSILYNHFVKSETQVN